MFSIFQPTEISIGGPYHEAMHSGSKRRLVLKQDTYQYVPLLPSLKSLLSDLSILEQVEKFPLCVHRKGILEDICDGELYKNIQYSLKIHLPYKLSCSTMNLNFVILLGRMSKDTNWQFSSLH